MKQNFIVSLNNCGICNRIKNVLSVFRIGQWLSRDPIIYWPKNHYTGCVFSELYRNDIHVISEERQLSDIYRNKTWTLYRNATARMPKARCEYMLLSTWRLLTLPGEVPPGFAVEVPSAIGNDIDCEFQRIPGRVQEAYVDAIATLAPIDYIVNQIGEFSREFDESTVSVSIRSWVESQQRKPLFSLADYFDAIDSMCCDRFFLSCDSPDIIKECVQRYRGRVLLYPKRTHMGDRSTLAGMQDILIDLYLLSMNRRLLATAFSTFAELAWWFGGCKAEVRLLGSSLDHAKQIQRRDRQVRREFILRNLFYKWYLRLHC